jgi:hypothetical protein
MRILVQVQKLHFNFEKNKYFNIQENAFFCHFFVVKKEKLAFENIKHMTKGPQDNTMRVEKKLPLKLPLKRYC